MKKITLQSALLALLLSSSLFFACKSGPKDADIQASIATAVSSIPGASDVTTTVKDGVVTIAGQFKDEAAKTAYENAVKSLKGVKSITDNATIAPPPAAETTTAAPPVINADDQLTKGVADATKDFQGVKAAVKDGVVTLTGEIKRSDLVKLMQSLNSLHPKKIENKLTIK